MIKRKTDKIEEKHKQKSEKIELPSTSVHLICSTPFDNISYKDGSKRLRLFTRVHLRTHSSHTRFVKAARMKGAKLRKFSPHKVLFAKIKDEKDGNVSSNGLRIFTMFASLRAINICLKLSAH